MTPTSIVAGFRRAGIVAFNKSIFTDTDFLPFQVTDRPELPESCKQGSNCESPKFEETTNKVADRPTSSRSMQDVEKLTTNEVAVTRIRSIQVVEEITTGKSFEEFKELEREPLVDELVLVGFPKDILYAAKILRKQDDQHHFEASFLRRCKKCRFLWPDVLDIVFVDISDVVMILPEPQKQMTKRL
ncbi:hypothetical protein PR048_028434 [Dryococelus australis]|uniref:Uncharacterized protein n=1 Tax=Dryococelus australis TaxID=614101 RepID=A0ABQ9GEC0_9NEOP|nr:hypothetical protein PR048_028434 [Dryococelus australis]